MSTGVRSRKVRRQVEEAYQEREEQLAKAVRAEVTMMHLAQTTELILSAVPQQRRWYPQSHGTHRPIGDVEHLRDVARQARHTVIELRDKVVTAIELEPWKPLRHMHIDLDEVVAYSLS